MPVEGFSNVFAQLFIGIDVLIWAKVSINAQNEYDYFVIKMYIIE